MDQSSSIAKRTQPPEDLKADRDKRNKLNVETESAETGELKLEDDIFPMLDEDESDKSKFYHPILAIKFANSFIVVGDNRVTLQGKNSVYTAEGDMKAVEKLSSHLKKEKLLDKNMTAEQIAQEIVRYGLKHYKGDKFTHYEALVAGFNSEHQPEFFLVNKVSCYKPTQPSKDYIAIGFLARFPLSYFWNHFQEGMDIDDAEKFMDKACKSITSVFSTDVVDHRTTPIVKSYEHDERTPHEVHDFENEHEEISKWPAEAKDFKDEHTEVTYHPVIAIKFPTYFVVVGDKRVMIEGENIVFTAEGRVETWNKLRSHLSEEKLIEKNLTPEELAKEVDNYGMQHYDDKFYQYEALIAGFNAQHQPEFFLADKYQSYKETQNFIGIGLGYLYPLGFIADNYKEDMNPDQAKELVRKACIIIQEMSMTNLSEHRTSTIVKYYVPERTPHEDLQEPQCTYLQGQCSSAHV